MKYILLTLILISCKSKPSIENLTQQEIALLDSMQFDKSIAAELKTATGQPFFIVATQNETGKKIPENMLPKMISCKVNKSFNLTKIGDLKERALHAGYIIWNIELQDGYISILISKQQTK